MLCLFCFVCWLCCVLRCCFVGVWLLIVLFFGACIMFECFVCRCLFCVVFAVAVLFLVCVCVWACCSLGIRMLVLCCIGWCCCLFVCFFLHGYVVLVVCVCGLSVLCDCFCCMYCMPFARVCAAVFVGCFVLLLCSVVLYVWFACTWFRFVA